VRQLAKVRADLTGIAGGASEVCKVRQLAKVRANLTGIAGAAYY